MRTYTFVDSEGKRIQVTASSEAVARQKIQLYYSARGGTEGQTFTLTNDTADFGRRGGDIQLPGTFGSELDQVTGDGGSGSGSTLPEDEPQPNTRPGANPVPPGTTGVTGGTGTEGLGITFPRPVFNQALADAGLDPNAAGRGFLDFLFGPAVSTERVGSALGISGAPTFADFTRQSIGSGGFRGLGGFGLQALQSLSQQAPGGDIDVNLAGGLNTRDAADLQNVAQAALAQRLSPTAFARFSDQIVSNIAEQFGRAAAAGQNPGNFATFALPRLGF